MSAVTPLRDQRSSTIARTVPAVGLVVLVPLAVAPGAAAPFHAAKWAAVCALVPIGLVAAAVTGPIRWPFRGPWLAWLGTNVAAAAVGAAPWLALVGAPNRDAGLIGLAISFGAFVLGASIGDDAVVVRRVVRAAVVAAGVVGLLAIADRIGVPLPGLHGDTSRARSTWGSATFAAGHLVLVAPLAVVHLRAADRRWRRIGLAVTAMAAVGLILTSTRGAWLGALAAAVVLAPALRRRGAGAIGASQRSRAGLPVVALVAAGVAAVVLAVVALAGPTLDRPTGGGRVDLWRTTASVIAERPLLGSGPDTQRIVLPRGIDDRFERKHGSVELHDRAHDLVLDTAVTTGLVGVAALGWLLTSMGLDIRRRLGNEVVGRAIAAGLVGYLVHLLFAFGDATLDPIAWLLAGLLVAGLPQPTREAASDAGVAATPDGATAAEGRDRSIPLVGALAVLCVAALAWGLGALIADHRLADAVRADELGDRTAALDQLASARAVAPGRLDLSQVRGRVGERLLRAGSPASGRLDPSTDEAGRARLVADALVDLDRAEAIAAGDPEVLTDRAAVLDAAGRHEEARDAFRAVVDDAYPSSSRAWLGLGTAEANLGNAPAAVRAWERAASLDPRSTDALANLAAFHRSAGRDDEAIAALRRLLERQPSDQASRQALLDLGVDEADLPDPQLAPPG
jgi:cytochrome c-type biogenesis protein CcmH/NrfG